MDRSDNGYRQRMDLRHYLLPLTRQVFCFLSAFRPGNHVDIGPGNKVIRLCRDKYQATYRFVFADLSEHRTHLNAELGLQGVHLFVGYINGDNSHVIKANTQAARRTGGNETKTAAAATQLVQSLGYHSRAGRRKWMAVGDGSAKHVKLTLIHFAGRVGAAQHVAGKTFARQKLHVCQRLCGKGFVHIN